MITAATITADWDEDGLHLLIEHDGGFEDVRVLDPEQLLGSVGAAVEPWLNERDHPDDTDDSEH